MKIKNLKLDLRDTMCFGLSTVLITGFVIGECFKTEKMVIGLDNVDSSVVNSDDYHERMPYLYSYMNEEVEKHSICLMYPVGEKIVEFRDAKSNDVVLVASKTSNGYEILDCDDENAKITKIVYDIPNSDLGEETAINDLYDLAQDHPLTMSSSLVLIKK